jgi:hypothetical protein
MTASLTSSSVATRDAICRLQQYARKRTEERGGLLAAGAQEDLLFGAVQKKLGFFGNPKCTWFSAERKREGGGFRGFAMGEPGQGEPAPTLVPSPI